jgi:hypothetical protein
MPHSSPSPAGGAGGYGEPPEVVPSEVDEDAATAIFDICHVQGISRSDPVPEAARR